MTRAPLLLLALPLLLSGCGEDTLEELPPCESGYERVLGVCEPICDSDHTWIDGVCWLECPSGFVNDTPESCVRDCPAGWEVVEDTCRPACPEGFERVGDGCAEPCAEGLERVGPDCLPPCAQGYARVDGVCTLTCEPPLQLVGGECLLICPDGYAPQGLECVRTCPPGYALQGDDCELVCPEGFEKVGDECVRVCEPGFELQGDDCIPYGGIAGLVCDPVNGGGLANVIAKVVLPDSTVLSVITAADGVFALPSIPPGPYQLQLTHPDGTIEVVFVEIVSGETVTVGPEACPPPLEICTNGADDDGDTLIDCADPDCLGAPTCFEVCNGLDDDADGIIDDELTDPALGTPCYEGPIGTEGLGVCVPGAVVCGAQELECSGYVEPSDEVCDGLDNDCDGVVPPWDAIAGTQLYDVHVQVERPAVDILFVIDDSGSMSEEQQNLANNFGAFITRLTSTTGVDYQIGIITTDTASDGHLVGPIISNSSPDPEAAFIAQINVGTNGSATEEGLQASRLAVSAANLAPGAPNEGFVRTGALLSVIYVSDEEDQSFGAVGVFADALRAAKQYAPDSVVVSAIAGDVPGGCSSPDGAADAGARYRQITTTFGGVFTSICAADWAPTMDAVAAGTLAALTTFTLSYPPEVDSITVTVCDALGVCVVVPPDPTDGWTYDPNTGAIVFHGSAVPEDGDEITFDYAAACVTP